VSIAFLRVVAYYNTSARSDAIAPFFAARGHRPDSHLMAYEVVFDVWQRLPQLALGVDAAEPTASNPTGRT
jgi:hypothetical protein